MYIYSLTAWMFVFQAILISMCLQGMVDELMMKKQGGRMKRVSKAKSDTQGINSYAQT